MRALQHEQKPQEIHFVLHGLPGFAVDLSVWNATGGLFWYLARNALAPGRPLHTNLQVISLVYKEHTDLHISSVHCSKNLTAGMNNIRPVLLP